MIPCRSIAAADSCESPTLNNAVNSLVPNPYLCDRFQQFICHRNARAPALQHSLSTTSALALLELANFSSMVSLISQTGGYASPKRAAKEIAMSKSGSSGGKSGGGGRPANAPSTTGNPSGGGRGNNPSGGGRPANAPSTTGNPSGGGRGNNPPKS